MSLQPGTHVGRFRVTRLIAQGGMAEVYRAEQELTGGIMRPAALKVIRPEYSESPDFREMFLDEARLACTLSHPNIVHIYEVGESDGRLFMAMELVPGESLAFVSRQLRDSGKRFSDEALIAVGIFTCSALEAVHALRLPAVEHVNLVHRDVSPHNLLLGPSGGLKLIDFGIAKAATNRNLTSPGVTKGKAGYFSPEQAMGKALDGRSDLFSLGVTLYKLAWGGTPFDEHKTHHDRNTALVHGRWRPLREVCPGLPEGFYTIVDKALAVKPQDRFANATEMRVELEKLALEGGFHVGASTLAGYMEPQADDPMALGARPLPSSGRIPRSQVAAAQTLAAGGTGVAITRQAPATSVAQPPPTSGLSTPNTPRRTEHLQRRTASLTSSTRATLDKTRRRLYVVSGSAVVLLATVLGLIIGQRARDRHDAEQAAAEPAQAQAQVKTETPKPQPTPPVVAAPEPKAIAEQTVAAEPAAKREAPVKPRRETPRAEKTVAAATTAEVTRQVVEKGDGRLRIGGTDDGEIEVNGRKWGLSPIDKKVPAGVYEVVVRSTDGRRKLAQTVEVHADRTALVKFNFDANAMTVSGN